MPFNRVDQRRTLETLSLYNNLFNVKNGTILHEKQCFVVSYYVAELCCRSYNLPHAFIFLTDYRAELSFLISCISIKAFYLIKLYVVLMYDVFLINN